VLLPSFVLGEQRRRDAVGEVASELSDVLHAHRDVAPLVRAAQLQVAAVVDVEPEEVVRLEEHVAELGEGDPDVGALEARSDGLLGDHLVHREVLPNVAEEVEQGQGPQPRRVVQEQRRALPRFFGELEVPGELLANRGDVGGELGVAQERALVDAAAGIPDDAGAPSGDDERPVPGELEASQRDQLQEVPDVQAPRRRVEPDVGGDAAAVQPLEDRLVGDLVHDATEREVLAERRHRVSLPEGQFVSAPTARRARLVISAR
jgi:hypothetical protein